MLRSQIKRMARDCWKILLVSLTLAVLTLLVYFPTLNCPFIYFDDPLYVFQNPQVQAGLTADSARWAFTTFDCGNWHPLTWLSLQLDSTLRGGLNAGGFHLTNVLLHMANTLLLFLVFGWMTGMLWRSATVAALFALHPLHVESVAWVAERKDVLSTLFWMLTMAAYVYYVRRPGVRRYLLVVVAFVLGLLAKPMLVTLPCVLLLLDYWPLKRVVSGQWRRTVASGQWPVARKDTASSSLATGHWSLATVLLEKLPLFALSLASCIITFRAQLQGQAVQPLEVFPLPIRIWNALLAYVGYLGKMLWPMDLAVLYPHPGPSVSIVGGLAAGTVLVIITGLVLGPGRRWPYLPVGWFWYLGTLVPVIGLVQVGGQAMADRYTYVPLIGIFLLLTWGVADLAIAWRVPSHYLTATTAVVLSACAVLTWNQLGYWKGDGNLWEHALAVTQKNAVAHNKLGMHYHRQGRVAHAEKELARAVAIDPSHLVFRCNHAARLQELGRLEEALAEYQQAAALNPNLAWVHTNIGNLQRSLDRLEAASAEYSRAIALDPRDSLAHYNLGIALVELGRPEDAVAEYRRASCLSPESVYPHVGLGAVLADLGRCEEALTEYHRAIALNPSDAVVHTNLGRLFQAAGRLEEALAEYRRGLELGDRQALAPLRACDRQLALRPRLPDLIAGRHQPATSDERLAFADLCRQGRERRYRLAAQLYTEAFTADPRLADDLSAAHRFHAACAAAAAGCGQGQDGALLKDEEKGRLRSQALHWLQSDLNAWTKPIQGDAPQARPAVRQALRPWLRNAELAGVRDAVALGKLPEAERKAWQKLWQEMEAALARARR
jgi:tetratricopeptide (TPR) repeat protein